MRRWGVRKTMTALAVLASAGMFTIPAGAVAHNAVVTNAAKTAVSHVQAHYWNYVGGGSPTGGGAPTTRTTAPAVSRVHAHFWIYVGGGEPNGPDRGCCSFWP